MSQDGYTLAETMAALVMIGLAVGGLGQAAYLIGRLNGAAGAEVAADRHMGAAQRTLDALLGQAGPFQSQDSGGFQGRAAHFVFPCDGGRLCGAELVAGRDQTILVVQRHGQARASRPLGRMRSPRFVYSDAAGVHDVWPAKDKADGKRTLEEVVLVEGRSGAPRPLAVATVWAQQPADCAFDAIAGDCREGQP